jgi:hypothetical protein
LDGDTNIPSGILFTDEANFYFNAEVNLQNLRYWSDSNPHWKSWETDGVVWDMGQQNWFHLFSLTEILMQNSI